MHHPTDRITHTTAVVEHWLEQEIHESESVKTMYLDATEFFISSKVLMIAQIVKMDAESANLMEITVFDGKTVAQATTFLSCEPSV